MDNDPHKTSPPHGRHQILVYHGSPDALEEFLEHIMKFAATFIIKYKHKNDKSGHRLILYVEEFPGEPDYLSKLFLKEIEFHWANDDIKQLVKKGEVKYHGHNVET